MTIEYKLPDLGEDIETGDVISVYVSPGDEVTEEQALMELETDKAALEIPSPASGIIKEVHIKEGDTIRVGQLLVTIEDTQGKEKPEKVVKQPKTEPGKKEKEPEELQESKEDKQKEESPERAMVKEKPREEEKPEERIETKAKEKKRPAQEPEEKQSTPPRSDDIKEKIVPASPTVRRVARELGIDIYSVSGTGPGGRISEEDVKAYSGGKSERQEPEIKPERAEVKKEEIAGRKDEDKWGSIERVGMKKVRRLTAERLTEAWKAPHVTQHDKADITEMEKLRKHYGKEVAEAGGKLTMTSIIVKVVASALKTFPQFNASIDMDSGEIIYKKYYNIGVAVDTDRGLLVPVIKDADNKNIEELSIDLSVLSEKARTKKVAVEELQGGTFTISNLGGLGGTYFTPVINAPEVAILGISRSAIEPVYVEGEFQPRLMLPLSLSYDHRLIDGADAVRFLRWIVEALEEPFKLSLEG